MNIVKFYVLVYLFFSVRQMTVGTNDRRHWSRVDVSVSRHPSRVPRETGDTNDFDLDEPLGTPGPWSRTSQDEEESVPCTDVWSRGLVRTLGRFLSGPVTGSPSHGDPSCIDSPSSLTPSVRMCACTSVLPTEWVLKFSSTFRPKNTLC